VPRGAGRLVRDAVLAGASSYDADEFTKVIERRPRPSYEERLAVFNATGRREPSQKPFPTVSKGGGSPELFGVWSGSVTGA
jgi:hypothetical protein